MIYQKEESLEDIKNKTNESCSFCKTNMIKSCVILNDTQAFSAAFNSRYRNCTYCEQCNYYVLDFSKSNIVLNERVYILWSKQHVAIHFNKKKIILKETISSPQDAHFILKKINKTLLLV